MEVETSTPPQKLASKTSDLRTRSFLPVEGSQNVSRLPTMMILCLVAASEGMDQALFPSSTDALVTYIKFDINNLAYMGTVQAIIGAFSGVFWGIMASRAYLDRPTILLIGAVFQGGATIVMSFFMSVPWLQYILRGVNGFALAALRPIVNSIVGDIFGDDERGKFFGLIMCTMTFGNAFTTLLVTAVAKVPIVGFLDIEDPTDTGSGVSFWGWHLMFIVVGCFTALVGPLCFFTLKVPKVLQETDTANKQNECQTIVRLLSMWTFVACAVQGCFGLIPWTAMSFRSFFFQRAGVSDTNSGWLGFVGGITAGLGNVLGGGIGDCLARFVHQVHGRVLCAELSIYGGIPIAYLTFSVPAPVGGEFAYFFFLISALGLVATWTPGGTTNPVLCTISTTEERALILAWQGSLEGSIGALGPILFTALLSAFGVRKECLTSEAQWPPYPETPENWTENGTTEEQDNWPNCSAGVDTIGQSAGNALFWCSCLPWLICGLIYTSLHYSYPRDLAKVIQAREDREAAEQMNQPLNL